MILLNIPGWSIFLVYCIFFWCFIGFFFNVILILCGKEFPIFFIVMFLYWFHLFWIFACFINYNINPFNNFPKSFMITFVSFTSRRITKKNTFVCSNFKLAKFFISPFDKTFTSKNSKLFYIRRLAIPKLIWSLISIYSNILFVENSHSRKCSFTREGCRSSKFI